MFLLSLMIANFDNFRYAIFTFSHINIHIFLHKCIYFYFLMFYWVFTRKFNNSTHAYLSWHGLPVEKKEIKDDRGEMNMRFVDCKRK